MVLNLVANVVMLPRALMRSAKESSGSMGSGSLSWRDGVSYGDDTGQQNTNLAE